jgi:hypothetical protein
MLRNIEDKMVGRHGGKDDEAMPALMAKAVLSPSEIAALRTGAAEILRPHAHTPAQQQAVDRLGTASLRLDDLPHLDQLGDADELTRSERRIVERARRVSTVGPTVAPAPRDPAIERAIAQATAEEAAATVAERAALDRLGVAEVELSRSRSESQAQARAHALSQAERDYRTARELAERARAQVVKLEQQRDARRRALLLAEHSTQQ